MFSITQITLDEVTNIERVFLGESKFIVNFAFRKELVTKGNT